MPNNRVSDEAKRVLETLGTAIEDSGVKIWGLEAWNDLIEFIIDLEKRKEVLRNKLTEILPYPPIELLDDPNDNV